MRAENIIVMVGWGIDLGDDAPAFGNPPPVVMVTTFLMWSTGWPAELSVMTALLAPNIGSPQFANKYAAMKVAKEVMLSLPDT